jgi:hypothetical protein
VTVRTCPNGNPSGCRSGIPTNPRICGFRKRMYAIVSQVVIPATTSIRMLEPRSEILKNRSRPPVASAIGTFTSWSCLVSDTRPPSLGRTADRALGGRLLGEGASRIGRRPRGRKMPTPYEERPVSFGDP